MSSACAMKHLLSLVSDDSEWLQDSARAVSLLLPCPWLFSTGFGNKLYKSHSQGRTRIKTSAFPVEVLIKFSPSWLNEQRELTALDRQRTQQQRPELPTVTLTWHTSKHEEHKLHQRCTHWGFYVPWVYPHSMWIFYKLACQVRVSLP